MSRLTANLSFEMKKIELLIKKLSVRFRIELDAIGKKKLRDNATVLIVSKVSCLEKNCNTDIMGMNSPGQKIGLLWPNFRG